MKKVILLLLITGLFLLACTSQPQSQTETTTTVQIQKTDTTTTITSAHSGDAAGSAVREFEITARQWEFEPDLIEVNEGDTVRLVITSIDVAHGFALPEFGVSQRLNPGVTETVEFVAGKKGTFDFWCNVACGKGHGSMRGQLVVR